MGVHVEQRDGCALVRLESGKVNAMDLELCEQITATFQALPSDPRVRAVVLTGNGRAFSAGVDLGRIVDGGAAYAGEFVASLARCFEAVLLCPLPTVAAVDGHAIAGGCVLASCTDHRLVVDDDAAQIGLTELAVGVPFPTAAIEVMRWRLGDALLSRRVLLADTVPASRAVDERLADEVVDAERLEQRAVEHATRLGQLPPQVFALTKAQLQADVRSRIAARTCEWEARVAELWAGEDVRGRVDDFVARLSRR